MFKFELGNKVKDIITGFEGIIMARVEYFTGCNQYGITPQKLTKEGKRPDWEYVDENRLKKCGKKISLNPRQDDGFDGDNPPSI